MTSDTGSIGSGSLGISVSGPQISMGATPGKVDSPDERKLKKAAGDFESILLASMWKSMKQTFGTTESEDSDPAHGTLDDWGIEVMSGAVGKAGGLGIGNMILKHLQPHLNEGTGADSTNSAKVLGDSADKSGKR
jgi:Rod binding domain-containing protein